MTRDQKIAFICRLDVIEAELFSLYRQIERMRLDLQREWGVLPSTKDANKAERAVEERG